ncbi:MAG: NADH:ubiquinone oxidoreductase [Rhizobium sp.]|nr:NADH:ubiquinone oxidoreductase [Rhizobium sp.]
MARFWRRLSNEMGETPTGKEEPEARDTAAGPTFAEASAKFIAGQTAAMTMMTAMNVNLATQMAGIFMGAMATALEKRGDTRTQDVVEKPKVVPLRVVRKTDPPKVDDLKRISGIGPKVEKVLHGMGISSFADIASWDEAEMLSVDEKLGLDNRIIRDDWVKQAKALLEG